MIDGILLGIKTALNFKKFNYGASAGCSVEQ